MTLAVFWEWAEPCRELAIPVGFHSVGRRCQMSKGAPADMEGVGVFRQSWGSLRLLLHPGDDLHAFKKQKSEELDNSANRRAGKYNSWNAFQSSEALQTWGGW